MTENNRLPRLDLHCHLDGSLSQGCIEELLGRSVRLEDLQADMECQSLAEYLEKFEIPLECLQTEKGLKRAGYDFMKNAAADSVRYIGSTFCPIAECAKRAFGGTDYRIGTSGNGAGKVRVWH